MQANAAERILVLSPAACEMLFAMGAGSEVVGVSDYCDFPERTKHLPHVANARQIFVEPALRLAPTLIVASNMHLQGLESLKRDGIRILLTHPRHISDVFLDMRRLGIATGHKRKAEKLVKALERELHVMKSHQARRIPVFFEAWSDPLMTQGGKSFVTEVIETAGGHNVFAGMDLESMRINIEAVLRAKPAVIVIPSKSGDIRNRRAFWHKWLNGVRVISINPDLISRPGPRLVLGVKELQRKLLAISR
ncbi:MAG: helical backbone metal receptor [Mariprofundaceae bacterium]|nr:helical backbone metal receptor [Mariprofundaceae bacterium]